MHPDACPDLGTLVPHLLGRPSHTDQFLRGQKQRQSMHSVGGQRSQIQRRRRTNGHSLDIRRILVQRIVIDRQRRDEPRPSSSRRRRPLVAVGNPAVHHGAVPTARILVAAVAAVFVVARKAHGEVVQVRVVARGVAGGERGRYGRRWGALRHGGVDIFGDVDGGIVQFVEAGYFADYGFFGVRHGRLILSPNSSLVGIDVAEKC